MSVTQGETSVEHGCERCGRPLPKKPQGGRPYRFCPDSPDEPGTSCLELDKRDRAALDRAGLGELVTAFRADRDALAAALTPVLGPLQVLGTRLQDIEQAAIDRAEHADADRLHAQAAQRDAERRAREAEQRTTRAYQVRDEALADRDLAVDDAQRHQRDADAAITRAVTAEHARGQAEGTAAEQRRTLDEERGRRTAADAETDRLRTQLDTAHRSLAALRDELLAAERRTGEATSRAQAAETEIRDVSAQAATAAAAAAAQLADLTEQRDRAASRLETAATALNELGPRMHHAEQALAEATARADQLQADLTAAAADTDVRLAAAHQQVTDAHARYQSLLTALAAGGLTLTEPQPNHRGAR